MMLKCVCGYEWDYKGEAFKYAPCPRCLSKLSIRRARERYLKATVERRRRAQRERQRGAMG